MANISQDFSDAAEQDLLRNIALTAFGLAFDTAAAWEASHNMIGLRSQSLLCSRRLDSRTYFVEDSRYGIGKPGGTCKRSASEQIKRARGILEQTGVPLDEIRAEEVLTEKLAVARVDRETGAVHPEQVQDGRAMVRMSRQSRGLPVWSSNLLLGLTEDEGIGFLQLHWPVLPEHVMHETQRLAFRVKDGWQPPEHLQAKVESVEAGVVHSPAVGFTMEIHPAIRVIYARERHGGKAMLYLNRHGQLISLRRHVVGGEQEGRRQAPQPTRK